MANPAFCTTSPDADITEFKPRHTAPSELVLRPPVGSPHSPQLERAVEELSIIAKEIGNCGDV